MATPASYWFSCGFGLEAAAPCHRHVAKHQIRNASIGLSQGHRILKVRGMVRRYGGVEEHMKAGDLLQQVRFPEFGLDRWRLAAEKALGGLALDLGGSNCAGTSLRLPTDAPIRLEQAPRRSRCDLLIHVQMTASASNR